MKCKRKREMEQFVKVFFSSCKPIDMDYQCVLNSDVINSIGETVSLAGFEYIDGEKDNSIGIEVKQCIEDFCVGMQHSFNYDINYLCVPSSLVGYALRYLNGNSDYYVGIIEYTDSEEYEDIRLIPVRYATYKWRGNTDACICDFGETGDYMPTNIATKFLYDRYHNPNDDFLAKYI